MKNYISGYHPADLCICFYIYAKCRFSVFETTAIVIICKFTVFSSGSFCQIYRVTDEALIAETIVWPNFFLINVFFAIKGSKLFNIISHDLAQMHMINTIAKAPC